MTAKEKILNNLKEIHSVYNSIKKVILEMCDEMDSSLDLSEKEKIKMAISKTEIELLQLEKDYDKLLKEISTN